MKRKLAMFMAIILMIGCFTGAVAENAAPDMPAFDAQPDSIWQKLADEGVISEETLSAIQQYLQENRPDMPEGNGQSGSGALKCPTAMVSPAARPKNPMAASPTANVPTMRPKCPAAISPMAAARPKCPTATVSPMAISPAAQ